MMVPEEEKEDLSQLMLDWANQKLTLEEALQEAWILGATYKGVKK